MSRLRLSLACGRYDHTLALMEGTVRPVGVEIDYLPLSPSEVFWRMLRYREFDASEMSLSAFIMLTARGDDSFVGIPVFPSRVFRHSFVFVNRSSGIVRPEELRGTRVGVPEYHMTAALFIRGFLSDDYGVRSEHVHWVQGGQQRPGRVERMEFDLSDRIHLEREPPKSLDDMLVAGEIDALATSSVPLSFREGTPEVRRLFESPWDVEVDWYERTRIYPIMHLIVIRRDVVDAHPWVARSLMDSFESAKRWFHDSVGGHGATLCSLPFFRREWEQTAELFGEDFAPYGLEPNRPTLEAAARYSHEQGLSDRLVDVDELFGASTTDDVPR